MIAVQSDRSLTSKACFAAACLAAAFWGPMPTPLTSSPTENAQRMPEAQDLTSLKTYSCSGLSI